MTAEDLIAALGLPSGARVDRRVPKTLLVEHGSPTKADKRRIQEGIEHVQWVATLKPTTVGVSAYRDEMREYLEIAVLSLKLRATADSNRLLELVHRAIPHPVLAVTEIADRLNVSVAHKRWSQGEAGKTVLDGDLVAVDCPRSDDAQTAPFLEALALNRQRSDSLLVLYDGWMDALLALLAAWRTGVYAIPVAEEQRTTRRKALEECDRLDREIARLRVAAVKEKQMARQMDLNLDLKRAESAKAAALARL